MHHFSCMARGRLSLLLDKKKNQQVYLITSFFAVSSLSRVYFKHVSSMTSELGEAGILDAGDHLTLLQVSPGYLGCGSK